jgi:hypothetical protein
MGALLAEFFSKITNETLESSLGFVRHWGRAG